MILFTWCTYTDCTRKLTENSTRSPLEKARSYITSRCGRLCRNSTQYRQRMSQSVMFRIHRKSWVRKPRVNRAWMRKSVCVSRLNKVTNNLSIIMRNVLAIYRWSFCEIAWITTRTTECGRRARTNLDDLKNVRGSGAQVRCRSRMHFVIFGRATNWEGKLTSARISRFKRYYLSNELVITSSRIFRRTLSSDSLDVRCSILTYEFLSPPTFVQFTNISF